VQTLLLRTKQVNQRQQISLPRQRDEEDALGMCVGSSMFLQGNTPEKNFETVDRTRPLHPPMCQEVHGDHYNKSKLWSKHQLRSEHLGLN